MIEYQTQYHTPSDTDTITITGRASRNITVVNMLVNGTGVETVDATIVYNTEAGAAIVCKALTQVTSASGAPTQLAFNSGTTVTFPIVIKENESLVLTTSSSAAGDMTFGITLKVEK